jgi:hypothetical protein
MFVAFLKLPNVLQLTEEIAELSAHEHKTSSAPYGLAQVFKASNYILGVVVFLPRVSWKEALFVT